MLLHDEDKHKATFRIHHGNFQWRVMPFGYIIQCTCNLSVTLEWNFPFFYEKVYHNFFYDILIYSRYLESHLKHLELVLLTLIDNHLYAKYSKCSFGILQIEYLGHLVSINGVQMDKLKVEAIL